MKKLLLISPLLLSALLVRADVVMEQKIESPMLNGASITKIKGDQIRVDSPMPGGGSVTTIIDGKTGDATTLMHAQKMAMKMNLKSMTEAAQKATAANPPTTPKATGQKEKVGDHNTEVYEMDAAGQKIKMWIAKDYPNAAALKAQMNKMIKATSGGMFDPDKHDIPGMAVKTEVGTPQGKMTMTLVSVKEQPVADTEFAIPTGYQTMEMPKQPGGQ